MMIDLINKTSIQNLVRDYSLETTVVQSQRIAQFGDIVPRGTRVYIAHVPGTKLADTVALAQRLRKEGMEPVPHIVARRIESLSALDETLARLTGEAGVTQILAVAGDLTSPSGQLESSLQVFESGLIEKYSIRNIGVAGHPEGHKDVRDPVLRDALQRKNAYARKTGAALYVVTQFTFTAAPVIAWEDSYGSDIGNLPIIVGLPGLASAKTLLKFAMDCGVGNSIQAFTKRYASLTKLLTVSAPDETVVSLARYRESSPNSRVTGVHFFTFGGFQRTAEWANKVIAGDFEVTEAGGLELK